MDLKNQVLTILFCTLLMGACGPAKKMATPSIEIKETPTAPGSDSLLTKILNAQPGFFSGILGHPTKNDIQIIYTQIDRNGRGEPAFTHHYFNVDPARYFYPASTVKLPAAILALQKMRTIRGLNASTTMVTEKGFSSQTAVYNDPTSPDGRPSIGHYIKKILLVSDNDAFNRLYEFLGQEYLNSSLHKIGFDSTQIIHRLEVFLSEEENRHTNPIRFYDSSNRVLYQQPLVRSAMPYAKRNTFLGQGFYRNGVLVNEPFDFSKKNRLTLPDLHSMVQGIMFPEALPSKQRARLEAGDYDFLRKYMSMYPGESASPFYDSSYNDSYVKFLYYGSTDPVEKNIRIFNKVGDAYGFLTDAAYIMDLDTGVEFLLSAVIHCNSDGIYNDSRYDYETVGLPFMKNLGRVIYQHELKRTKKYLPDLSPFTFHYRE